MVTCSCGKVIDRVPSWLNRVQVEFICNNCPNRTTKNITQMTFTTFPMNAESDAMSSKLDTDETVELEAIVETEAEAALDAEPEADLDAEPEPQPDAKPAAKSAAKASAKA